MQTWGQKVALKHVHLPMSTAAFILTPLSPPTHMGVRHMAPCPPLTTSLHGLSHMLSSISKCVVADQDTIKTLDHLPVHAGTDGAFFHPHAAPSPVEPQNQTHSKPNWDKLSPVEVEVLYTIPIEEQLGQIKCPTLEECLKNPTLIDQYLTTPTTLSLQTAYSSIPLKSTPLTKSRVGMTISTRHSKLPNKLIKCGRLLANPGTQTIPCAITTNPLRENSALSQDNTIGKNMRTFLLL